MSNPQNITDMNFKLTFIETEFNAGMARVAQSAEKVITSITKAQEEMGAKRLATDGLLRDSQNRVIEGEKNWQIAMGYTRDEMGRLLNAQGQVVEGLSQVEQKLGMNKDAFGNVYNAQGILVKQSEEFAQKMRYMGEGLLSVANLAITFSAGSGEAAKKTKMLTAAFGSFSSAVVMVPKITSWYKSLTLATKGQTTAQVLLNAVTGNWATIAIGIGAAAATIGMISQMEATGTESEKTTDKVENLTGAIKKLNDEAMRTGKSVWGFKEMRNVISTGMGSAKQTLFENILNRDELQGILSGAKNDIHNWEQEINKSQEWLAKNKRSEGLLGYWWEMGDWLVNADLVMGTGSYDERLRQIDATDKRITELRDKIKTAKNTDDKGVTQGLTDLMNSAIASSMTEVDQLRMDIDILKAAIEKDEKGQTLIDVEKGNQAIESLNKKIQSITDAEFQKTIQPLEAFAREVEKTEKQFGWLKDVTEEIRQKMSGVQKAALEAAEAEYERAKEKAGLMDAMGEEKYKLYEQINAYVSPMEQFATRQGLLNDLLENASVSIEGWLDAVEKNKQALYSSSKYNTFIQQAIENAKSYEEKKAEGILDITNRMTEAGETLATIKEAVRLYVEKLDADELKQKAEQVINRDLAAAERGSMEAYKIVNNNREDKTVKAIEKQTKELNDAADRREAASQNRSGGMELGVVGGNDTWLRA